MELEVLAIIKQSTVFNIVDNIFSFLSFFPDFLITFLK